MPEPGLVSSEIARPTASIQNLDKRMVSFKDLENSPLRGKVKSRLAPGSAPSKFKLVSNLKTDIDGCTSNELIGFQTYMDSYAAGVKKLSNRSSQKMIKRQAKLIQDLVPKKGYRSGDWYNAVTQKQALTGLQGTTVDYKSLTKDPYFQAYSDLVTSIENLKSSAGL